MYRRIEMMAVAAVFAFAVSCGGSSQQGTSTSAGASRSSAAMSLEEYFDQLESISQDFDQHGKALANEYQSDMGDVTSEAEALERSRQFMVDLVALGDSLLRESSSLQPPQEVKDKHDALMGATQQETTIFRQMVDDFDGYQTMAEFQQALQEAATSDAVTATDDACFALQGVADQESIDVDLNCD